MFSPGGTTHPNLGNPEEITVSALAQRVIELVGSESGVEIHPLPIDDPLVRQPDIALARDLLGWSPRIGLAEGLVGTIDAFRAEAATGSSSEASPI